MIWSSANGFQPFAWVPWGVYIGLPPRGTMVIRLATGPNRLSLRSPGRKRVPVQSRSPDDGAPCPTVGAKCRRLDATYAKGWLIMVGASRTSPVPGNGMRRRHARRRILPSFRALQGDNTPTAALRGLRMITLAKCLHDCSFSCFLEVGEGKASSLPPI